MPKTSAKSSRSVKVLDQSHGDRFSLYHGDSVEVIKGFPDNSIDLTVTSPPFSNLYQYSDSDRDMGNTEGDEQFMEHFDYLIPELFRVTTPGRLIVLHCKDLPLFKGTHGVAGLRDFPAMLTRRFCGQAFEEVSTRLDAMIEARSLCGNAVPEGLSDRIQSLEEELIKIQKTNWVFHSRVTIWKCPKTEMERTNNHGLLHNQLCKDSSVSRQGMADYLMVYRKWSDEMLGLNSTKPVTRPDQKYRFNDYVGLNAPGSNPQRDPRGYSIEVWQRYASPVWFDIKQTRVLNTKGTKIDDERHLCPLQLDVCDRAIELWSNPGDVVFDCFNGWGSTGYSALKMQRHYTGIELNPRYYQRSIKFLQEAENSEQLTIVFT